VQNCLKWQFNELTILNLVGSEIWPYLVEPVYSVSDIHTILK
jgi:hypothetical protein